MSLPSCFSRILPGPGDSSQCLGSLGSLRQASELKGLRAELAQAEAEAKEARAEAHQACDGRASGV